MYDVQDYLTPEGRDPFKDWLAFLPDRMAKARIAARVQRLVAGNFGDCKPLTDGVWELRIDHGPGYRVSRPCRETPDSGWWAATSVGNRPISRPPWRAGKTGKGETHEGIPTP